MLKFFSQTVHGGGGLPVQLRVLIPAGVEGLFKADSLVLDLDKSDFDPGSIQKDFESIKTLQHLTGCVCRL